MPGEIAGIHEFWFGELDSNGLCAPEYNALWFSSSEETDRTCRERYSGLLEQAVAGELEDWADSDEGLVALVVLLDQFSRNIHRGTPRAFAGDARALQLALAALDCNRHLQLPAIHRVFLYMPLEHSEDLALQERCVELFEGIAGQFADQQVAGFLRYAVAHRDVIARFGRFPHRNQILGRTSSGEEVAWLQTHGGF
jgi:uncharacterized protein (DUF924 family)